MESPTLTALKDQSAAFLRSGLPLAEAMASNQRRRMTPMKRVMRMTRHMMMFAMVVKLVLVASKALMGRHDQRVEKKVRDENLDRDVEQTMDASDPITKY